MLNKREATLFICLAFCLGIIFSDITRIQPVNARVTNIVYEDLDRKITVVRGNLARLTKRVDTLEQVKGNNDAKTNSLAQAVKSLTQSQSDILNNVEKLDAAVSDLRTAMRLQNNLNKRQ